MSKHSQVAKGARARHTIEVPFGGGPQSPLEANGGALAQAHGDAVMVRVALRVLLSEEHARVAAAAHKEAIAAGLTEEAISRSIRDPQCADDAYRIPLMQHTIALACLDDDVKDRDEAYFERGVADVKADVDRDTLVYIFQAQQRFEELVSPSVRTLTPEALVVSMAFLGAEDEDEALRFFERFGPGTQWIFTRTLARQRLLSLTPRSPSGSGTEGSSESSTPGS